MGTLAVSPGLVRAPRRMHHRMAIRAQAKKPRVGSEPPATSPPAPAPAPDSNEPTDFWEVGPEHERSF